MDVEYLKITIVGTIKSKLFQIRLEPNSLILKQN